MRTVTALWVALIGACSGQAVDPVPPTPRPGDGASAAPPVPHADTSDPPPQAFVPLSPERIAARLTRFLWAMPPDAALVQRVTALPPAPHGLRALAGQMLSDPRARAGLQALFRWWLMLDDLRDLPRDATLALTPSLRQSLIDTTAALGVHITLDDPEGTLQTLLVSPKMALDRNLADLLGVQLTTDASSIQILPSDHPDRVGLFATAGMLTRYSSYGAISWSPKRTWMIEDLLLCFPMIRSIPPDIPPPDPGRSMPPQILAYTVGVSCQGCHKYLDQPGFAFTAFDGMGRHRQNYIHSPQDAGGTIHEDVLSKGLSFDGPADLMTKLASRSEVRRCVAQRWLTFALLPNAGPTIVVDERLRPHLDGVIATFASRGHRLRGLFEAVVESPAFWSSNAAPGID